MPPAYARRSSVRISFSGIGGMCAVRHALACFPYFAVASALCLRHQYRVPPSRRLPTETIWHPSPSGIGTAVVSKSDGCSPVPRWIVEVFFMDRLLVVIPLEAFEPCPQFEDLLLVEPGSPTADDLDGRAAVLVQDVAQRFERLLPSPLDLLVGREREEVRADHVVLHPLLERVVIVQLVLLPAGAADDVPGKLTI